MFNFQNLNSNQKASYNEDDELEQLEIFIDENNFITITYNREEGEVDSPYNFKENIEIKKKKLLKILQIIFFLAGNIHEYK